MSVVTAQERILAAAEEHGWAAVHDPYESRIWRPGGGRLFVQFSCTGAVIYAHRTDGGSGQDIGAPDRVGQVLTYLAEPATPREEAAASAADDRLALVRAATDEMSRRSDVTRSLATVWAHPDGGAHRDGGAHLRRAVRAEWPGLAAQLDALVGEFTVDPL